jgi:hypothetical protein
MTAATTTQTITKPTDGDVDAAILAALDHGEMVPWRSIRHCVPGTELQRLQAVTRLFESRAIYWVEIRGRSYMRLEHGVNAPGPVLGQLREFHAL